MSPKAATTGSGPIGRAGPWTAEQNRIIDLSYPAWHEFCLVQNKGLNGRHPKIMQWKQDEATRIVNNPDFGPLPAGMTCTDAKESIVRKFTNYRNNRKEKPDDRHTEIEALKNVASALLDLRSFSKGKALFKKQKKREILERKALLMADDPTIPPIGAFQKATKQLWDEADQDRWEAQAGSDADEIFENQKRFPENLFVGLRAMCQVGGLGELELITFFAFRDEADRIRTGAVAAHHRDDVPDFGADDIEEFRKGYERWARGVLPRKKKPAAGVVAHREIGRNASGRPVFPILNLDKETTDSLREVVGAFFQYAWKHYCPNDGELPWDILSSNPEDYYDPHLHQLPEPLLHPSKLSYIQTRELACYLMEHSSRDSLFPFEFRKQSGSGSRQQPLQVSSRSSSPHSLSPTIPHTANVNNFSEQLIAPQPLSPPSQHACASPLQSLGEASNISPEAHRYVAPTSGGGGAVSDAGIAAATSTKAAGAMTTADAALSVPTPTNASIPTTATTVVDDMVSCDTGTSTNTTGNAASPPAAASAVNHPAEVAIPATAPAAASQHPPTIAKVDTAPSAIAATETICNVKYSFPKPTAAATESPVSAQSPLPPPADAGPSPARNTSSNPVVPESGACTNSQHPTPATLLISHSGTIGSGNDSPLLSTEESGDDGTNLADHSIGSGEESSDVAVTLRGRGRGSRGKRRGRGRVAVRRSEEEGVTSSSSETGTSSWRGGLRRRNQQSDSDSAPSQSRHVPSHSLKRPLETEVTLRDGRKGKVRRLKYGYVGAYFLEYGSDKEVWMDDIDEQVVV